MITTTQVRAIIKQHRPKEGSYWIYTNKTKDNTSNRRRVKTYFQNDVGLLRALQKAAGAENVYVTEGSTSMYGGKPGLIVRCVLG